MSRSKPIFYRLGQWLGILAIPLLLMAAVLALLRTTATASSHREAPLISKDAFADNTDTYVFVSPENPDNCVNK